MNDNQPNYWHCPSGEQHAWIYRKDSKAYLCTRCLLRVTKLELKEHTDA